MITIAAALSRGQAMEIMKSMPKKKLSNGVIIFLLTEETLYTHIDNKKYTQLFAGFLCVSGLLLIIKSL